jgi:hypothetical protein
MRGQWSLGLKFPPDELQLGLGPLALGPLTIDAPHMIGTVRSVHPTRAQS